MVNYINERIINVLLNVQIQVKFGKIKANNVHQNVLHMKNIHMNSENVNQDVIQVKSGKLKSVFLNVRKLNIFPI